MPRNLEYITAWLKGNEAPARLRVAATADDPFKYLHDDISDAIAQHVADVESACACLEVPEHKRLLADDVRDMHDCATTAIDDAIAELHYQLKQAWRRFDEATS